jgi:hypothetical protein
VGAGDSVLTVTIQQAKDAVGTGLKTLKVFTLPDSTLDTAGQSAVFEVQASELDVANDFTHVRVLVAATDNVERRQHFVRVPAMERHLHQGRRLGRVHQAVPAGPGGRLTARNPHRRALNRACRT